MATGCGRCGNLDIAVECSDCGGKIRSEPVPLCGECNELIHEGVMKEHRVETLDAKRKRSDFKERLESFEEIKPKVKFQLSQINKAKKDVEQRLQNNLYNIQQSFLEVGKVFKKKEQEFLLQLRSDASSKMTSLQEWHQALTEHKKQLDESSAEADKLHRASPTNFLEGLQDVSTKMQELSEMVINVKQPSMNAAVSLDTSHLADQVMKLQLKSGSDMKSAPTFTKEIVPLVPPKEGDTIRAYVEGRIDAKGHFWLCPDFVDSVANVLDDLSFEIRRQLIKKGQSPIEIKEGMFCVAEFQEDNRWYRAKVERVDQNKNTAQVKWMDYAHVNEVPLANIQALDEEFKDIPFQALECCLLENFEGSFPREARWEFSDIVGQNCLDCTVQKKIDREDHELPLYHMRLVLPDRDININEKIKSKVTSGAKEKSSIGCRDVRLLSKEEGGIKELHNEKIEVYSAVINRKTEAEKQSKPMTSKAATESDEIKKKTTDKKEADVDSEKADKDEKKESTTQAMEEKVNGETKDENKEGSKPEKSETEKVNGEKENTAESEKASESDKPGKDDKEDSKAVTCNGELPEAVSKGEKPDEKLSKTIDGKEKITILTRDKDGKDEKGTTKEQSSTTEKSKDGTSAKEGSSVDSPKPRPEGKVVPPPDTRRSRVKPPAIPEYQEKEEVDSLATMLKRQQQDGRPLMPERGGFGGGFMNPYMTPNMAMVNPALQQIYGSQTSRPRFGQKLDQLTPGSADSLNIRVSSALSEDGTFLALKIRGPDEEGRFRHLMKEISMETDPQLTEDVAPGKLMCAYYSTLNQWCRAHIIDTQDAMVLVWFCDFGTTEAVPSTHIRFLELRHHLFPFQSAEYSIATKDFTFFPRESQDTFRNITTDKIIKATVVDPTRRKPQVSLSFLNEVREEVDVLKVLTSAGLMPTNQQPQETKGGRNTQQQPQQDQQSQQQYQQQQRDQQYQQYGPRSQDMRNPGGRRDYNYGGGMDPRDGYYRGGGGGGGGGMQQQKNKGGGGGGGGQRGWDKPKGRNQRKGRYN